MRKINLVTDSTSDLSPELLAQYHIIVWPLYVNFGEESFRDIIDIDTDTLYQKVEEYKELPKTAALSPGQFYEKFKQFSPDEDVIFMGIGSKFSISYQNACTAAEEFDNIYVVDSNNLSSGIGLQLLKMAKFRDQGMSAKEIVEEIKKVTPLVSTRFAINTLEYLHKGGRCSGTARFIGTALNIKPIIKVVDGGMVVSKKPMGYKKALNIMLSEVDDNLDNIDKDFIMVTHSKADEDAKFLVSELQKRGFPNVCETKASCVISTHCGPRTIGILFILKQ